MLPFTQNSLDKIEALFKEFGFKLRYEKGNFRTGACVLQHSKVIVVNKFSNLEVKIQSLIQILHEIPADEALLDEKQRTLYQAIRQTKLSI
ncbi:hypothetical protein [Sphingobacterium spiritivorum]|uniref:Uncharacterized protein n=1 Tax=Sphingobacterium spiritivorum ATCC 33861 TaxID=525373 RepID=D7VGA2_SPHSI|nr:hypothetical protein [Sphingobacterium spiritivorum]EFK60077.1 hypothetical protein HMPREF0766_10021 [Sphingobacterium spiritivorum ATCC 33861]QQT34795.1 hypothetical protein I6J01_16030 [Sphingobacterium spiritivorum]WQD35683.1 hypothetical protein U0038_07980 [Sphingobacterium spiritivorum]SUJ01488.1 Uncharacterised protein [Sphingobacterium spiritivorum]